MIRQEPPPPPPGFRRDDVPPPPPGFQVEIGSDLTHNEPGPTYTAPPDSGDGLTWQDLLPGWRAALRFGFGAAYGAVGLAGGSLLGTPVSGAPAAAMMGGFGMATGEGIYQLLSRLGVIEPEESLPETSGEAAATMSGAMTQGAIQEFTGPALSRAATGYLRGGIREATIDALNVSGNKEAEIAEKIAAEFSDRIPFATSIQNLYRKVRSNMGRLRGEIESAYNAIPEDRTFQTGPILDALRKSRAQLFTQGELPPGVEPQLGAFDELIAFFEKVPTMTIRELRKNRQIWDGVVRHNRAPGAAQPAKEEVFQEVGNLMRGFINDQSDDIARLNNEFHIWKQADEILQNSRHRGRRGPLLGMGNASLMAGGGTLGAAFGGAEGAFGGVAFANLLAQAMNSTAWKTASVPMRRAAIKALEEGATLPRVIGILSGGAAAGIGSSGLNLLRSTADSGQ